MFKYKNLSLNIKIAFVLFLLGFFLLTFLFVLLIPKIQEEQYKEALNNTEKKVLLIKQQIRLVVDYFKEYGSFRKEEAKKEILNHIEKAKFRYKIDKNYTKEELTKEINEISKEYNCQVNILKKDSTLDKKNFINFDFKKIKDNEWLHIETKDNLCPHPSNFLYKTHIKDMQIELNCSSYFKPDPKNIELRVKKIIQEGFSLSQAIHKGKVFLMWVNKNPNTKDLNTPLTQLNNEHNKNYCISKISNIKVPTSGELTLKEILKIKDTNYLYHKIENKDSITFVSTIYENDTEKFIFLLSAFEDDFKSNINSPILRILPISIFALLASIFLGIIIFKKWIRNIDRLSTVAKAVKNGDLSIRSEVKGSDELGLLGVTFDLMLDDLEDNIKNLDKKIEERTQELTKNVKSKEILLRELNHRVKNNLFMIINFIKLQKSKLKSEEIIDSLNTIENRIYTISLIHTKLFELKSFDSICAQHYINDLIDSISNTFNNSQNIKIKKDIQMMDLDIETAMNCGLILNELITNSFKYAFDSNKNNLIKISFYKASEKYNLIFEDNGKGLKDDFDINSCSSLGMKLINSITTYQLNGEVKVESSKGLRVSISFAS
ncbi:hypothetical protein CRV08_03640 [Halarcobacter ebronensis]|uniref:histidine kinase n=1 Tax=Halarcobacter ebronensis TaxID=1462615 RepID=A0A4Q0YG06_9BACT|nr:histidine kinase dimerization/phosphoacceptor domain -containing protein [Halarcobacter ebronensis]RXJ69115.1 hypothetical protein CRV08_03640 [Halarcobacter ebronensis]